MIYSHYCTALSKMIRTSNQQRHSHMQHLQTYHCKCYGRNLFTSKRVYFWTIGDEDYVCFRYPLLESVLAHERVGFNIANKGDITSGLSNDTILAINNQATINIKITSQMMFVYLLFIPRHVHNIRNKVRRSQCWCNDRLIIDMCKKRRKHTYCSMAFLWVFERCSMKEN